MIFIDFYLNNVLINKSLFWLVVVKKDDNWQESMLKLTMRKVVYL